MHNWSMPCAVAGAKSSPASFGRLNRQTHKRSRPSTAAQLNRRLRHEGHHRTLFAFYQELIRLRKELPALVHASKEQMEVLGFEREKILYVRRWCEAQGVCMTLHFGHTHTSLRLPLPMGWWHKRLDSAEERWSGPGSPVGLAVESDGEVTLTLPPESCLLFAHTAED